MIRGSDYEFEVLLNDRRVGVNLDLRTCDCKAWELKGIPCIHALACISSIRAKTEDYCDNYFTADKWKKCFSGVVHPIPSRTYWPTFPDQTMLQTPLPRVMTGRPKLHRRREVNERGPVTTRSTTVRCRVCKQQGHNRRKCRQNPTKDKGKQTGKKRKGADLSQTEAVHSDVQSQVISI